MSEMRKIINLLKEAEITEAYAFLLNTGGDGLWSNEQKTIEITNMVLEITRGQSINDIGELKVYFNPQSWDIETDGLIYTDEIFLNGLVKVLSNLVGETVVDELEENDKLPTVDYSEQGMQGDNYISLDVNQKFIDLVAARKPKQIAVRVTKW